MDHEPRFRFFFTVSEDKTRACHWTSLAQFLWKPLVRPQTSDPSVVSMAWAFLGGQFQQDVFHLSCLWREEYGTLAWKGLREDPLPFFVLERSTGPSMGYFRDLCIGPTWHQKRNVRFIVAWRLTQFLPFHENRAAFERWKSPLYALGDSPLLEVSDGFAEGMKVSVPLHSIKLNGILWDFINFLCSLSLGHD